jgi:hypothetical protein
MLNTLRRRRSPNRHYQLPFRHYHCVPRPPLYSSEPTDCLQAGIHVSNNTPDFIPISLILNLGIHPSNNTLGEEIQTLDDAITRFSSSLIPPHQFDVTLSSDTQTLIVVHTLLHTATIHLYSRFARDDPISYDKCLRAARSCVAIIKHIPDTDYNFLDPIIGVRQFFR